MKKIDQDIKNLEGSVREMETARKEHEEAIENLRLAVRETYDPYSEEKRLFGHLGSKYEYLDIRTCRNCHRIILTSDADWMKLNNATNNRSYKLTNVGIKCCANPDHQYSEVIFTEVVEQQKSQNRRHKAKQV